MKKINLFLLNFMFCYVILQFFGCFKSNFANAVGCAELTSAESMITIESYSGRVLYSKDKDKKLPMASTTKIITAIVAIENCKDVNKKHLITKDMTGIEGSSIYLKVGEHLSILDLLYGLMLRSGNDAAVAIAIIVGGSVENFVKLMNEFCIKLGANDTNIVTVNGLHDDNHYTTASDLAKVTAYALKNETFAEIVKTKEKVISSELDTKYKCRLLKNKNKILKNLVGADGVKTGFTKKAGRCFVGSATRDGMQIICVVLNCGPMFEDATKLIEEAFAEYRLVKLFNAGVLDLENVQKTQFDKIYLKNDVKYPLSNEEISKINAKLNLFDEIGLTGKVGTLDFKLENDLIFSVDLFTIINSNKIVRKDFFDSLNKIVKAF